MASGRSSSCSDPFAIFSFMAFALAVANLVMNMNAGGGRRWVITFIYKQKCTEEESQGGGLSSQK